MQRFLGIYQHLVEMDSFEVALRDPKIADIVGSLMETDAGRAMESLTKVTEAWKEMRAPIAAMLACSLEIAHLAESVEAALPPATVEEG